MKRSFFPGQSRRPVQSDPILADFFASTTSLRQAELDYLVKHNVPTRALVRDGDNFLSTIGAAWTISAGSTFFDFAVEDDEGALRALIFVARDRCGGCRDLVSWWPRTNKLASQCGKIFLLGEHELKAPRTSGPLALHRTPLGWLKAARTGVVIIDSAKAWLALTGAEVLAEDVDHGLQLRKLLTPPAPRILVRDAAQSEAA